MQLERITVAVTHMPPMVAFYNALLDTQLQPTTTSGSLTLYKGVLGGIDLVFCPNEIAEVDARQNRKQLRLTVDDLSTIAERITALHGEIINEGVEADGRRLMGVRDPDGNTLEFVQRAAASPR